MCASQRNKNPSRPSPHHVVHMNGACTGRQHLAVLALFSMTLAVSVEADFKSTCSPKHPGMWAGVNAGKCTGVGSTTCALTSAAGWRRG